MEVFINSDLFQSDKVFLLLTQVCSCFSYSEWKPVLELFSFYSALHYIYCKAYMASAGKICMVLIWVCMCPSDMPAYTFPSPVSGNFSPTIGVAKTNGYFFYCFKRMETIVVRKQGGGRRWNERRWKPFIDKFHYYFLLLLCCSSTFLPSFAVFSPCYMLESK